LNILFTCAGRRVSLLRSFREAMAELGVAGKLLVTELTEAAAVVCVADEWHVAPAVAEDGYIERLLEVVRARSVGLLVPLTDLDLLILSMHREEFAEAGCTVMIAPPHVVDVCRDKRRTNELVAAAGLEPIASYSLKEFLADPFYPCFIKPVDGSAAVGAARIEDDIRLHGHVATYEDATLVQEYIGGQEFTMDVYRSRDDEIHAIVPRQRLIVRGGEVQKGVTVNDPHLIDATRQLVEKLEGIWGAFCCQCRREPGGEPRFFEINPRFGGGVLLSIAAGVNLPLYLLQEVLGMPITSNCCEFTDRLVMLRYDEALYRQVDDVTHLPGYDEPEFR
jgi:carbamoyl-phosphate synthase large subunit